MIGKMYDILSEAFYYATKAKVARSNICRIIDFTIFAIFRDLLVVSHHQAFLQEIESDYSKVLCPVKNA